MLWFCFISALTCGFNKVQDKSDGLSSGCSHIEGGPKSNFADCESDAKEQDGNVINWGSGNCYFKLCDDVEDLRFTSSSGSWDVYQYQCQAGEVIEMQLEYKNWSGINSQLFIILRQVFVHAVSLI